MVHNGVIIWAGPAEHMNESGVPEVHQFVHGLVEGPLTNDWTNDQIEPGHNGTGSVTYVCQQCGARFPKWAGKCEDCGAWNTLVEERKEIPSGPGKRVAGHRINLKNCKLTAGQPPYPVCNQG